MERSDWGGIPDLKDGYEKLRAAIREGNRNAAEDAFVAFRRAVLTSPDLIKTDSNKLIATAKGLMESVFYRANTASFMSVPIPEFHQLKLY